MSMVRTVPRLVTYTPWRIVALLMTFLSCVAPVCPSRAESLEFFVGADPSAGQSIVPATFLNAGDAYGQMLAAYGPIAANSSAQVPVRGVADVNGAVSGYNRTYRRDDNSGGVVPVTTVFACSGYVAAIDPSPFNALRDPCVAAPERCAFSVVPGRAVLLFTGSTVTFSPDTPAQAFGFWLTGEQDGSLRITIPDDAGLTQTVTPLDNNGQALNLTGEATFYGFIVRGGAAITSITLSGAGSAPNFAIESIALAVAVPLSAAAGLLLSGRSGVGLIMRKGRAV
jgi:hypothetical protein